MSNCEEKTVNDYLVTLKLRIGEYEKIAYHRVRADNDVQAYRAAIEGECHGEPEWIDTTEYTSAWDMGEMIYEVDGHARVLSANEVQVLKNVGIL